MKKPLILFIVLSSFFFFLLVPACFAAYYQFANPTTAQVQIQPEVKQLQHTTMLHVVTGSPDATKQQIAGARLLSATTQQTATQTATGKDYTAATHASGEMSMEVLQINGQLSGFVTLFAGSVLTGTVTGGHGVSRLTVISNENVTVNAGATGYFHAHAASPGSSGNIWAHTFVLYNGWTDKNGNKWGGSFTNTTAFTGGQNSGSYSYVKPEDITRGEQALEPGAKQQTLTALHAEMKPGEQWVQAPGCVTHDISDGTPNQMVANFHVTASATCTGEVYDPQVVEATAGQALIPLANQQFGGKYQLHGKITSTINGVQVTDQHQGTLAITLTSTGTWTYAPTNDQKLHLAQLISGKSVVEAQKLLMQQTDITHVTIMLDHSFWIWNAVPTDAHKISIVTLQ